ncbi:hypothetical protein MNBD_GAMMA26-2580 [hydrothermal vent metagenome]|uniref:Pyridoxamine 5'-phosphate oxidase N-terminal domain-containing protein n=1 Tax=hydrothermal vent metagenome TaxID=652676 RepID=A0A3B1BJ98_9ZZZZ
MGKKYPSISKAHQAFIKQQKIFFVATAPNEGRINLSPKDVDSLHVQNGNKVLWLNLTGSGNETAAHLLEDSRITIMLCAFDGAPKILRLYGSARAIHPRDDEWSDMLDHFPTTSGARQIIEMDVEMVHSSCGFGVPLYDFVGHRDTLAKWITNKGEAGITQYWQDRNTESLDGKPTGIFE